MAKTKDDTYQIIKHYESELVKKESELIKKDSDLVKKGEIIEVLFDENDNLKDQLEEQDEKFKSKIYENDNAWRLREQKSDNAWRLKEQKIKHELKELKSQFQELKIENQKCHDAAFLKWPWARDSVMASATDDI